MQDRVSLYPGRVNLEPVAGQTNTYDLTRADQPTQEGTPINKANLLSDATAAAIKALLASQTENPATPNEALNILAQAVEDVATVAAGKCSIGTSTYTGNGKFGSANPTTLTFPKKPTLLFVLASSGSGFMLMVTDKTPATTNAFVYYNGATWGTVNLSWQGSTLRFYSDRYDTWQGNESGSVYQVVAFYAQD